MQTSVDRTLNLVFVHLGSGPTRHLIANLRSTRMRFPRASVTLIADGVGTWPRRLPRGIRLFLYRPEVDDRKLVDSVTQDMGFRDGFWLNTSRRFLALAQLHRQVDGSILHIESDVALLSKPAAPLLMSGREWAYSLAADRLGVGALVFSKSAKSSRQLADFFVDYFADQPGTSDMYVLGAHFHANRSEVLPLPAASAPESSAFRAQSPEPFRQAASEEFDLFGGVFDGGALGTYLLGTDGRNHRGFRQIFQDQEFYDLDYSACSFRHSGGYLELNDSTRGWVPVHSLHIHSKHPGLLGPAPARSRALKHYCELAEGDRLPVRELDIWALAIATRDAIRRRVSAWS